MRSRVAVGSFAPPLLGAETLRHLARTAIEAAVHAGAEFADVRVSDRRQYGGGDERGDLLFTYGCGVRVRVHGHEAFGATAEATPDGVIRAARSAVATARALAAVSLPPWPLVPVPVTTGEWTTPLQIDPFTVSPDDHAFVGTGYRRTYGQYQDFLFQGGFTWVQETRVVASSEGTLVTQHATRCLSGFEPGFLGSRVRSGDPSDNFGLQVPAYSWSTAGFEATLGSANHDLLEATAVELTELLAYPVGAAEVGRRDVVLDGIATGSVLGTTLLPTLQLSRVLGDEQDAGGTSMLAPPEDILGHQIFSPRLTFGVDPGMPHYGAARWDDEGVATTAFPLVERGAVVNYLGTRATLPGLAESMHQSTLLVSPGAAFTPEVMTLPSSRPGTVTMQADAAGPSFAELIQRLDDGIVLRNEFSTHADQQGASGIFRPRLAFEVRHGKIVRRLKWLRVEFATKKLWTSLAAVGNATTMQPSVSVTYGGLPWNLSYYTTLAPATLFQQVNIASNHVEI